MLWRKNEKTASRARPKVSGKTALFPRNDRPYGLKCEAFQTENALERFTFEKGETRGGGNGARPGLFLYSFPEFDYPVRYDSLPAPQANDNTLQEHP